MVLRLLLTLWRMAPVSRYLGEVLLEHLLLGLIILVEDVWVVHIRAMICVIIMILLQRISITIERTPHPRRNILTVCNRHRTTLIMWRSWTEAYHLRSISVGTKFLWLLINGLVSFIYGNELFFDILVIRHVLILKLINIVENVFHLLDVLGLIPQKLLRIL